MKTSIINPRTDAFFISAAMVLLPSLTTFAEDYSFVFSTGDTYYWNVPDNWTSLSGNGTYPHEPGDTAVVNYPEGGTSKLYLNIDGPVTIKSLVVNFPEETSDFKLVNKAQEAQLILDSGSKDVPAEIKLTATTHNTSFKPICGVPIIQNNDLLICLTNSSFDCSAAWTSGVYNIDIFGQANGGTVFGPNSTIDICGSGRISYGVVWTNGIPMPNKFSYDPPGPDFTGEVFISSGNFTMSSNPGLNDVRNMVSCGEIFSSGTALGSRGSSVIFGSNSSSSSVIKDLFPENWAVDGGKMSFGVRPPSGWTNEVLGAMSLLWFRRGYTYIECGGNWSNRLDLTELRRSRGSTLYMFSGGKANWLRIYAENINDHLKGAGGSPGSQNMSIIPWVAYRTQNSAAYRPQIFATYDKDFGIRMLNLNTEVATVSSEASLLAAGDSDNIYVGAYKNINLNTNKTVNSYWMQNGTKTYLADGVTLTVSSGAIGSEDVKQIIGNPCQGRLSFGDSEGIIWGGTNLKTFEIGSCMDGTNGLTIAQLGTVTLCGTNTLTGPVNVGSGVLRLGNDTNHATLPSEDISVHPSGTLRVSCENPFPKKADITLMESAGLFFATLEIDEGLELSIDTLKIGDEFQCAGTYGSSDSGAQFTDDRFFAGTGILRVKRMGGIEPMVLIYR